MKPEQKFSAGGVEASIWNNKRERNGEVIEIKSVTFQKRYKDKDEQWKSTNTLNANDIPKALVVLSKAYEALNLKEFSENVPVA